MSAQSMQERYAPENICFGCGPANEKGLRIRSFEEGDHLVATWRPEPHHQAFPGVLNGGVVGALLDCHSNWAAIAALMRTRGLEAAPCTVTSDFSVTLRRPTPVGPELALWAKAVQIDGDRVTVEATLTAEGKVCATCRGTFVAVKPDHPAYHRW
jgi:acyl-coenzyme A thioesterase PaaI-like protein